MYGILDSTNLKLAMYSVLLGVFKMVSCLKLKTCFF